ncbi:hypothetical protein DDB_G0292634 [Dictyostelium discoideum AX4]|uniref:Carbohydrate binding domain-containing protein n=1 Tax=Dictyostelium discoideum TaxID=44689 RepID=Q54CY4_DICDI|nr:hypothetical protein DDB_G0292634 [Dictyostelium discoideum AX4]EAL61120.1 hypothetical protein DDB_G0292634 [Dictyostelium discoideum AX4]|eukprot:XP_629536.1 hypothetical protein DDB_G0292634 [Dictyostelium discoideum AX4]
MNKLYKILSLFLIFSFIKEIYCIMDNNNNKNPVRFECIPNSCLSDHSCIEDLETGKNKCVDDSTRKVIFQSTIVTKWHNDNDNDPKMHVSVEIINENVNTIHNLVIVIDSSVRVIDLWGMNKNKSVYQLPSYVQIPPNSTHNFGYICDGFQLPKIFLGAVYIII